MPKYKRCPVHGEYTVVKGWPNKCPECKDDSKRSKKYGGVTINIPPNMRSVK